MLCRPLEPSKGQGHGSSRLYLVKAAEEERSIQLGDGQSYNGRRRGRLPLPAARAAIGQKGVESPARVVD